VAHLNLGLNWCHHHYKSCLGLLHDRQWTPVHWTQISTKVGLIEDNTEILLTKKRRTNLRGVLLLLCNRPWEITLFLDIGLFVKISKFSEKGLWGMRG
jgi:hypothetical protein